MDCSEPLGPLAVATKGEEWDKEYAKAQERCQCGHKRKHHASPDCLRCLDKGELSLLHEFTPVQIPDPLAPRPMPGTPLAVVYETADRVAREMLIPPGAAAVMVSGGILVQHEVGEVLRIVSVRQLIPGEVHAPEDPE